jgi:hypothetical protein
MVATSVKSSICRVVGQLKARTMVSLALAVVEPRRV